MKKIHKLKRKLTDAGVWEWLRSQPLSPRMQRKLDRLFDKINAWHEKASARKRL